MAARNGAGIRAWVDYLSTLTAQLKSTLAESVSLRPRSAHDVAPIVERYEYR
jgi:hypothetical protein